MDIPALPFCHLKLKGSRPIPLGYPKSLKTLGDHLRKKRLDLKLLQKDVAQRLGVDKTTIYNWESGHAAPSLSVIPRLIAFLGYIPFEMPANTLGEKIRAYRKIHGITIKSLAWEIKVDPTTLGRWEMGKGYHKQKLLEMILKLFS